MCNNEIECSVLPDTKERFTAELPNKQVCYTIVLTKEILKVKLISQELYSNIQIFVFF